MRSLFFTKNNHYNQANHNKKQRESNCLILDEEIINKYFVLTRKVYFLLKIAQYNNNKNVTALDIEKWLGFKTPQPDFQLVFNTLITKKIVFPSIKIRNVQKYNINKSKLIDFIESLEFYNKIVDFIKDKTGGAYVI